MANQFFSIHSAIKAAENMLNESFKVGEFLKILSEEGYSIFRTDEINNPHKERILLADKIVGLSL